eukprot:TRINITY_DN268_c0_g2_i1.p1 TRINITY_DN268_c0_g2~~TRINITY_DN268_c0_g2_i1.p1  ORF type:complete len:702 (-),score=204.36 TRINITY_DN268_c0_g2_i1:575-2527(-)
MAQLTYDSVDLNEWSRYRAQNRFSKKVGDQLVPGDLFGDNLEEKSFFQYLRKEEYKAIAYMYASEKSQVFQALKKPKGQDITEDVWIGYIAYSETNQDIVVAWRGTLQPAEWVADAEVALMKYDPVNHKNPPETSEPKDPPRTLDLLKFLLKGGYAALAFVGAAGWGGLSAFTIALLLYLPFTLLESESFLGAAFTFAFSAATALPLYKFFIEPEQKAHDIAASKKQDGGKTGGAVKPEDDKKAQKITMGTFVLAYAGAVGVLTLLANLATSPDRFWSVDSLIFALFVLLPTGLTAASEAWECAGEGPQVHEGFYELYDPTGDDMKPLPKSGKAPRHVVHETVEQLLSVHTKTRTISVTGHSLGGALAVLSAYDIVESGCNVGANGRVQVACFAFEAPRVGNPAFKDSFEANHVKNKLSAIRVVNKPDIVTQVPKAFFLQNVYYILAAIFNSDFLIKIINRVEELNYWPLKLPSAFQHVAPEQELVHDSREVDYLKKMPSSWNPFANFDSVGNYHNLEVNLHLVSGYWSKTFSRDFAMCNKSAEVVDPRAGVPPNWFAAATWADVLGRSKGNAIIEPYNKDLPSEDEEADKKRKIGEGPVASRKGESRTCKPLVRDYFARYLKDYEPPEKNLLEKAWEKVVGGGSPEQKK